MCTTSTDPKRIAIVGGGAGGLMAAGTALSLGADVTVYEHSNAPAKKLRITGKGRCNVTNNCTEQEFLSAVVHNPRFLYTAIARFSPQDTISLFEGLGVALKTERGRRVFPESDKASDIVDALLQYAKGAKFRYEHVRELLTEGGRVVGIRANQTEYYDAVILASGGKSYPGTGSDGSGYRLAEDCGHNVTQIRPSLVPLVSECEDCRAMMGLSLRNVGLKMELNGKVLYEDFGELLFTHFGLSGPTVLSASSHLHECDIKNVVAVIDLKPAMDEGMLDARLLSDFSKYRNRNFANALSDLLPAKMIPIMLKRSGISLSKKVNEITKEERRRLLSLFKRFTIPLCGFRPISEAIITAGGISVKDVAPSTMESRIVENLFFAGEVLDVDAYTGGYNLQIAFSTGYLAGKSAAEK